MPSVLIVDGEAEARAVLAACLAHAGLTPLTAATAAEARELLGRAVPDLVLLEAALPDGEGAELCRELRRDPRLLRLPVLFVSARAGEQDRIAGLEAGADDYVVKPVGARELGLRIRAVLRRAAERAERPRERVGPIRLDLDAHQAFVGDDPLPLTLLEFRLLSLLMSRVGRVQRREALLADVWDAAEVDPRAVDTQVRRLREKLGPARDLLRTVRRVGYQLVDPAPPPVPR